MRTNVLFGIIFYNIKRNVSRVKMFRRREILDMDYYKNNLISFGKRNGVAPERTVILKGSLV